MKISLIIPHMFSEEADAALERCLESFKGQYDELILIINDGMGYGQAVNMGLKWGTGDYFIISNNDIELKFGSLRTMPWAKGISVPIIEPEPRDYLPRAIFCIPRWAYKQISSCGYFYDPQFKVGFWEDDDLIRRLGDIKVIKEDSVLVNHLNGGGLTMKKMGEQKYFEENKQHYINKWELLGKNII